MSSERNNYFSRTPYDFFFLIIYWILKEILQLLLSRGFLSKLVWDAGIFKNKNPEVHRLLRKQMEFQNFLKIDCFFSLRLKDKG